MKIILIKGSFGCFLGVGEIKEDCIIELNNPVMVDFIPIPQPGRIQGQVGGVAWIRTLNPWPMPSLEIEYTRNPFVVSVIEGPIETLKQSNELIAQYLLLSNKVTH